MDDEEIRKYSYIIYISNTKYEEYEVNTGILKTHHLEGHFKDKIRMIKSLILRYSNKQKKKIIVGGPIVFYREYLNYSTPVPYDDDENYVKYKKKSFFSSYNKVSYKYFYKKILDIVKPDEIVDIYSILENETENKKGETIILKQINRNEFICFNKVSFSKLMLKEVIEIIENGFITVILLEKYEILSTYKLPVIFSQGITVKRLLNYVQERKEFSRIKKREILKKVLRYTIQTIIILLLMEIIMIGIEKDSIFLNIKNKYYKDIPSKEILNSDFKKIEYQNNNMKIYYK
jgi:hypothetical protein